MPESEEDEEKQRCEYVFDPDDSEVPEFAQTAITEEWECPHYAKKEYDGKQLCLLHLPTSEKEASEVTDYFLNCVNSNNPLAKQFVGGKFKMISLPNLTLGSNDNRHIDLRYSTFDESLDFRRGIISQPLLLTGSEIRGELKISAAKFHDTVFAQHIKVDEGITCIESNFEGHVNFRNSVFNEHAKFRETVFEENVSFYGCEFNVDPDLPYEPKLAEGNHRPRLITFTQATFSEGINLNSAEFNDVLYFDDVTVEGTTHLDHVEFKGKEYQYWYIVSESDAEPEKNQNGHVVANIGGGNHSRLRISPDVVANEPYIISLRGTTIESGMFSQLESKLVYYDFSEATLGDIQLRNMDSADAWRYLIFNKTDFDGFDFTDYREALDESEYDLCNIQPSNDLFDKPELREKEITYTKAGIGADMVRDRRSSSEFHIREIDNRRARLKEEGDWFSFVTYLLYGFTSRYGESPRRVLFVFTPLLLGSYWLSNSDSVSGLLSDISGLLFAMIPPIFSSLLILASYRYIGD